MLKNVYSQVNSLRNILRVHYVNSCGCIMAYLSTNHHNVIQDVNTSAPMCIFSHIAPKHSPGFHPAVLSFGWQNKATTCIKSSRLYIKRLDYYFLSHGSLDNKNVSSERIQSFSFIKHHRIAVIENTWWQHCCDCIVDRFRIPRQHIQIKVGHAPRTYAQCHYQHAKHV